MFFIFLASAQANSPSEVVTQYLEAMQRGEVELVKSYLGGNLLKKRIVLLEQNKKYSSFLKNLYRDAEFIVSNDPSKFEYSKRIIDIQIIYPTGTTNFGSLVVVQEASGEWKIVDHIKTKDSEKRILRPPPEFKP